MLGSLKMGKSFYLLVLIIPIMTVLSFLIYYEYIKTKKSVFVTIQEHLIAEKIQLFKNYGQYIISHTDDNIKEHLSNNTQELKQYNDELKLLQGEEIKYLYLLYRGKDGKFRFLLDATTNLDEKAEFNQKFDPETDIWNKAYDTKSVQIVKQKELQTLWVTIAYPLVKNGEVIAVLGADFSYKVYIKIVDTMRPLEQLYFYVSTFMMIMLILAYILIFLYYKTRKKSFIDPLTKVYNRQYLSEFLETTSLKDYHLMMIDLDHFKRVNDTFGHNAGDEVLISVVQKIKSQVRQEDVLVRFGGEEFLLLVYKKELKDSIAVAQRIRKSVMNSIIESENNQIKMTLSIGINPFPYYAKNIEEAIKIADEQLYIAKASGRNRIEVFDKDNINHNSTSKRISDIQSALDENRIKCAFQPILSSKTKKILKYEILLRLINKEGKIILSNEFLSHIRHTQVYINLTRFVIDTAINVLKKNSFKLAINLDIQDILNDDIVNLLKDRFMNEAELAQRLTIEILEHEKITNFELIKEKIFLLKKMGFVIALDNFGSSHSNYSQLINLDIQILKIDGSIIKDIDKGIKAYNILKTIISFAKSMNIRTVAEHVETQEEFKILCELEIDYLQGYYLGRPEFDFVEES